MKPQQSLPEHISAALVIIIVAFGFGLAVGAAVAGFKLAIFLVDMVIK